MADATNPRLDGDDIQGNIFPGFRRRGQLLVGYRAPSEGALRAALAVLAPRITSLLPVLNHRDSRKAALGVGAAEPELPELWTNLALGAGALDRLGEAGVRALDEAFDVGMRPARTGDPWSVKDAYGQPNPAHPSNWKVGLPTDPLDLLVILAFDDWVQAAGDALLSALAAAGIQEIYRDHGVRLPNDSEHFGFVDGISEPGIRGFVEIAGEQRLLTTRYGVPPRDGLEFGKPGQVLVWPGQFLVGTPTGQNQTDISPARYKNSSFLVFRRLSQDVRGFDQDTVRMTDALSAAGEALELTHVRAMIVGRWPSGAALMRHAQDPGAADGLLAANYFSYGAASPDLQLAGGAVAGASGDPAPTRGLRCPAFAHIRKVNPRDLPTDKGDAARTRSFQMLRRGIPFGPAYDRAAPANPVNAEPRGLLFLAYQRAISSQFESLNSDWMNSDKGPGPGGFDLFVGQRVTTDTGLYAGKTATLYDAPSPAPGRDVLASSTWVTPSGGAYLFAPSLSHIRALAANTPATPAAKVRSAAVALHLATFLSEKIEPLYGGLPPDEGQKVELPHGGLPPDEGQKVELPHGGLPRRDGETHIQRRGGRDVLIEGRWPATALLAPTTTALSGAALESLDLSGEHFPTETLSVPEAVTLAEYPDLRCLALDGITLDGATLTALVRQLDALRILDLGGCDLDDADVATLAHARPSISSIRVGLARPREGHRFTAPRLTARVLGNLSDFGTLQRVGLRGVKLSDIDVAASDLWDRLDEVDLGETQVGDASALRLAQAPRLRNLELDQTAVGDAGAKALLARPLEGLSLAWTRVSRTGLSEGPACPNLRRLDLAGTALEDDFADVLDRFIALKTLDISRTGISDRTVEALAACLALDSLNVAGTRISAAGVARLSASRVADLNLQGLPANAEAVKRLAASPRLRRLTLSVADWTGLAHLHVDLDLEASTATDAAPPSRLRRLWLRGNLTPALSHALAQAAQLHSLTVNGSVSGASFQRGFASLSDVRAEGADLDDHALASLLEVPGLEALYISGNPFGEAMNAVTGKYLHTLELRRTVVDDRAVAAIARLPRLHCLDLPFTQVSAGGVARLVAHAGNLQSLALDARQVDAGSVRALANHGRLIEIYLYGREVDEAILRALAPVRLRDLSLVDTGLTDDAVPILAAMPRLRALRLGSELSDAGITSLRALRPDMMIDARPGLSPSRLRR